jgi:hypothetical protein
VKLTSTSLFLHISYTDLFSLHIMICIIFPITVCLLQNNERGFPLIFTITVVECSITEKFLRNSRPTKYTHGLVRFHFGLERTNTFQYSLIRMCYDCLIRSRIFNMFKYKYYCVWVRTKYRKLRTNKDCHGGCRIVSVANPVLSRWRHGQCRFLYG